MANLRPSSVAAFVEGLDPARWSVQAHAGNGIVRAHALGEWTLDEAARQIDRFRAQAVRDGGNLILSALPDRVEGTPPRLGRAPARLGDRRAGQARPSIPTGP